jgi:HlyD family secretion protein
MGKVKKTIIAIASTGSIAIILAFLLSQEKKQTLAVNSTVVTRADITNSVTATGTVEPIDKVDVGTQVSGVIKNIYVDFNSVVKKGQLLAELDRSTLNAQVLQSKASLASAENELQYREQNFNRVKKLYEGSLVSETEFEEAQYQYNSAKTNVSQLRSKLEQAEVNLSYASIYSPIDGVILNRSIEEGQTVAASFSTPTLFSIAKDLTKMQVEAKVDEADIGQVKVGQRVLFTVDAYPDDKFNGDVVQIRLQPTTSANVVTYTVIIEAPNPSLKLMPGMTASIEIIVKEAKNVLTITPKALQFEPTAELASNYTIEALPAPGGIGHGDAKMPRQPNAQPGGNGKLPPMGGSAQVGSRPPDMKIAWVIKGKTIQPHPVRTGMEDGATVEIIEGLNEGDSVVTSVTQIQAAKSATPQNGSPFMPKPPQRNRRN